MINSKLTAEQKISKAKVAIINQPEWRWLGSIVMMGNLEFVEGPDARVPTAATDGMNEVYNRDFLAKLSNEQVMFLVLHENFHKLFRHMYVWQSLFKENAQLANIACVFDDTLVTMGDGAYKRAIDVMIGDAVMTPFGAVNVTHKKISTKIDHCELVFPNGNKLQCTHDHRILTETGYKYAKDITTKDKICVDSGARPATARQPWTHTYEGLSAANGMQYARAIPQDTKTRAGLHTKNSQASTATINSYMDANGLGILCGASGWGGDSYMSSHKGQVLTSSNNSEQHVTRLTKMVRELRDVWNIMQERAWQSVLAHFDKRVRDIKNIGINATLCEDTDTTIRHSDGDYSHSQPVRISFPIDTTHHELITGVEGYKFTRVSAIRRFEKEQRVVDITTPTQCFVANGVVVHNCDAVINNQYLIGQKGIAFIDGGVDMPKYKDKDVWNAKKIFDDLKQNGGVPQGQDSLDTHEWEKARDATPEEVARVEKQIDTALRQAALAGNISGGMPRHIKEMLVPKLDWRQLLSEFLKTVTSGNDKQTWRKPHRTYVPYGFYMPAPYSESVGRILIAGDTSGSIGDAMLGKFLGHMQTLCNEVSPDGVDIAWWGSSVVGVDTFERGALGDLANAVKPIGGGGTTPACITDWMKKNKKDYICTIVITDGEFYGDDIGDWGDMPVLWLVINMHDVANIPVGITVKVAEMD